MHSGNVPTMDTNANSRAARPWPVLRCVLGLWLLTAAILKIHQLATEPIVGDSWFDQRALLICQTLAELGLGLWLLSGLLPRLAWGSALACFVVFASVTLHKALSGAASCGCFGKIEVNPWITLVLDGAAVAALGWCRPPLRRRAVVSRRPLRLALATGVWLAIGIPAAFWMASYTPTRIEATGAIVGDGIVVLEPETWLGKPLGLLQHIDIGQQMGQGRWQVMLFDTDCPHCRDEVPQFIARARAGEGKADAPAMALVEIPPHARSRPAGADACRYGRLSAKRDWFVETPVVVELDSGTVVAVNQAARSTKALTVEQRRAIAEALAARDVLTVRDEYDFGFVEPNSRHIIDFVVANAADAPLTILRTRSECKCMTAPAPPTSVPAGGSVKVRVVFVAPKESMRYSKRIVLQTTDKTRPVVTVRVKADVGRPLVIAPKVLEMGDLPAGGKTRGTVTIHNRSGKEVRLAYSTSSQSGCIALIPRAPVPAGGQLSVPIAVTTTAASARPRRVTVTIHTDCAGQRQLSVPVRYTVVAAPAGPSSEAADASSPAATPTGRDPS